MTFKPYLHWTFHDEHVLFSLIVLNSTSNFLLACLLVVLICLLERPKMGASNIKAFIFMSCSLENRCYVLAAMSFHIGLVLVIVASLSAGQLAIELHNLPKHHSLSRIPMGDDISQPLLSEERAYPKTRPRSKSKPDDIFIHPAQSNIARADAVALELGLAGETERVQGFKVPEEFGWEFGKGKDLARDMLLGSTKSQRVLSV